MATETLYPDSDVSKAIPASIPAGAHWSCLDDASEADYVYSNIDGWAADIYGIQNHSVGSGTINSVTIYITHWQTGASRTTCNFGVKTGGTEYLYGEFMGAGTTEYNKSWATNPNTLAAWTWDDIDALQGVLKLRRNASSQYSYVSRMRIVVDYTEAPAGWANIAKICGVTATDIAKVNGVAVADIAKVNGVAV